MVGLLIFYFERCVCVCVGSGGSKGEGDTRDTRPLSVQFLAKNLENNKLGHPLEVGAPWEILDSVCVCVCAFGNLLGTTLFYFYAFLDLLTCAPGGGSRFLRPPPLALETAPPR